MGIQFCKKCLKDVSDEDAVVLDYKFTCPTCKTQLVYFGKEQSKLSDQGKGVKVEPVNVEAIKTTRVDTIRHDGPDSVHMLIQADLQKNPNDTKALNQLAKYHRSNNAFDRAEKIYVDLIKLEPKQIQYYRSLADIYATMKQFDKAINILKQMAQMSLDDEMVFYNLGIAYAQVDNVEESKRAFVRARQLTLDLSFKKTVEDILKRFESDDS